MNSLLQLAAVLAMAAVSVANVVKSPDSVGNFELLILHNNDMHARFEQTSQLSGACTDADRDAGKCYGGFARVAHVVKEARKAAAEGRGPPVLYLNAGDTYTGTAWFTIYKWKIAAEFINALQPDAVSLGNHEFDDAVEGVLPFIRNLTSPVLAANLILDDVPELQEEPNLKPSIVLSRGNFKIGIIGYLTPDTKFLAPKNKVEYEDEVIAIRREVRKLKEQGVNILIALGHSGFIEDLIIAKDVEGIDLVIGGHSNTFLWNNKSMETEEIEGPYPEIVRQSSGRMVPVVQAYAYTKYMGKLHLVFDSNNEIVRYDGNPILLNQQVPRDPELMKVVEKYRANVNRISNEVIGTSMVFLNAKECRLRECNIGNLITDALLYYTKFYHADLYSNVNIALTQGGRIRASIENKEHVPFNLTRGDWITVLPFSDNLSILTMNGTVLRQTLEHSVDSWRTIDTPGQFLQFSGMKVIYDLAKPPGSRVVKAQAICSNCPEPTLSNIEDKYEYKLVMSTFLAETGDGYSMFEGLPKDTVTYNELTCILAYLNKHSPVNPSLTGRSTILNENKVSLETMMANVKNKTRVGRVLSSSVIKVQSSCFLSLLFLLCSLIL